LEANGSRDNYHISRESRVASGRQSPVASRQLPVNLAGLVDLAVLVDVAVLVDALVLVHVLVDVIVDVIGFSSGLSGDYAIRADRIKRPVVL